MKLRGLRRCRNKFISYYREKELGNHKMLYAVPLDGLDESPLPSVSRFEIGLFFLVNNSSHFMVTNNYIFKEVLLWENYFVT